VIRGLLATVGQDRILLPVAAVREVFDAPTPTRLPGRVDGLEGVFALRGRVLPLWRADLLLGLAGHHRPATCVRMATGDVQLALLVDAVGGLVAVTSADGHSEGWWTAGSAHLEIGGRAESVIVVDAAAIATKVRGIDREQVG
jgi:chemotaxis signal transduction protein